MFLRPVKTVRAGERGAEKSWSEGEVEGEGGVEKRWSEGEVEGERGLERGRPEEV